MLSRCVNKLYLEISKSLLTDTTHKQREIVVKATFDKRNKATLFFKRCFALVLFVTYFEALCLNYIYDFEMFHIDINEFLIAIVEYRTFGKVLY